MIGSGILTSQYRHNPLEMKIDTDLKLSRFEANINSILDETPASQQKDTTLLEDLMEIDTSEQDISCTNLSKMGLTAEKQLKIGNKSILNSILAKINFSGQDSSKMQIY